ncbi:MAG TPA: HAMP domain-containing sensor histidine kinase [bacterium]|nr:HAMP domain-containing sensor histidine kinase [bacterium]HNT66805.1 HAMP domain-containing sensor histidine kinase [bacterium]HOX87605.1 HAMP domain-containing sensor histidine kinase [bacterium]HPG47093.1 HAMP domain-containing sensor histidine kinase [bacterium]HPM99583.1 HAMP domain-containing sensor histidine kinase [bacterium]
MQGSSSAARPIVIFILALTAWFSLVGLWIYAFISNHLFFSRVSEWISPRTIERPSGLATFIGGMVLLFAVSIALLLIFRNYTLQLSLNRLYDGFIAAVTHELKSPLASIQLYLETLRERQVPVKKQKEFFELMLQDTQRLKRLINSILDIAALEQKKIAYNFQLYDADELISGLLRESRDQFKLPVSAVHSRGHLECQLVADASALLMVFNNLMDNAIKYSTEPPQIEVRVYRSSHDAVIRFSDQGIGLAQKKNQKKIFEKFYRLHDANSPTIKGTGLGLYWVREIIRVHGGRVWVHSAGKGKGMTVAMELPIYPERKKRTLDRLLDFTRQIRQGKGLLDKAGCEEKESHSSRRG